MSSSFLCCCSTSWQEFLRICHVLLGICGLCYCRLVFFQAAEACYMIPCYEGPGLQATWKVNKGITFVGESSGVVCLMHAVLGYLLFRSSTNTPAVLDRAHFLAGIFTACTCFVALISFQMVWVWGAEWNLLGDLTLLNYNNKIFEESGRHMIVNQSLLRTMTRLFYWSATMGLLQILILIQLLVARGSFSYYFGLQGGSNLPPVVTGDTHPHRYHSTHDDEMTPLQNHNAIANLGSSSMNV